MEIRGYCQNYEWGKRGDASLVGRLAGSTEADKPYAELWMGEHHNGMNVVKDTNEDLTSVLLNSPHYGNRKLTYLFKILSVDQPLSIQSHPDKHAAARIKTSHPDRLADSNLKAELSVAISQVDLLCGFRPTDQIREFVANCPPLAGFAGSIVPRFSISTLLTHILTCPPVEVASYYEGLHAWIHANNHQDVEPHSVFLRLGKYFPGDVGCFFAYLLRFYRLAPGESLYIPPNTLHAYISGDMVEGMTCSDNVIRAGLTPKQKDVDLLLELVDYESAPLSLVPQNTAEGVETYNPPQPFRVFRIGVPGEKGAMYCCSSSPGIVLTLEGKGMLTSPEERTELKKGVVVLLRPMVTYEFSKDGEEELVVWGMEEVAK